MYLRVLLVAALCVAEALCGDETDRGCASPTRSQLENAVIGPIVENGANPGTAVIELMDYRIVCRAFDLQQDLLQYVSVVVQYSCTGHENCPSGTAKEQFEASCNDGQWGIGVLGASASFHSMPTEGTSITTARDDCFLCASQALISSVSYPLTADPLTHCTGE